MLQNYCRTALHNLLRYKLFSVINIIGLSLCLAACILIGLFVRDELSYDQSHRDAENIYLISRDYYPSEDFPQMQLATNAPQAASPLHFAYRIDLTPLVFIGSGLVALGIGWVTVGDTATKAANAKPVLALRYE